MVVEKRLIIICFLCIVALNSYAKNRNKTNHALVIGVDKYKYDCWKAPSKLKQNIDMALEFFETDKRYNFQICSLRNEAVTLANIKRQFQELAVSPGDYVMIYMNGHGDQVADINGDEYDKMDEVFICYDSPPKDDADFAQKVLIDDLLNILLNNLRERLGPFGQVFMLVEACHSSTIDKNGKKIEFREYGKNWRSAFLSEDKKNITNKTAPLIVFSSSRAFLQTSILYEYSRYFLSEFEVFEKGSYYDLFHKFYCDAQRRKISQDQEIELGIELTVNIHVEDPTFLQLGVFDDTTYSEPNFARIINIVQSNSKSPEFQINKGIYAGITNGTKVVFGYNNEYRGTVYKVTNGSSWVKLNKSDEKNLNLKNEKNDLWCSTVEIAQYNFQDTLLLRIDDSVNEDLCKEIKQVVNDLNFIKVQRYTTIGYSLVYVKDKGLFIKRNRDNIGLYKVRNNNNNYPDINDIRSTLLRLQISHFIMNLNTKMDTSVSLVIYKNGEELKQNVLKYFMPGDSLALFVHPEALESDRYYCVLHIEDEVIKQLVPVNFQINDSECKLLKNLNSDIFIGSIRIGTLDGKFLLITSETPFDLREALNNPINTTIIGKKAKNQLNEIEKLINNLFLNRSQNQTLYNPKNILLQEVSYWVEK